MIRLQLQLRQTIQAARMLSATQGRIHSPRPREFFKLHPAEGLAIRLSTLSANLVTRFAPTVSCQSSIQPPRGLLPLFTQHISGATISMRRPASPSTAVGTR